MPSAALRALVCSMAIVASACTTMNAPAPHAAPASSPASAAPAGPATPAPSPAAAGSPSPRPGCSTQHVTIYFTDVVQSDQPVATPLLDLMMNEVHACQRAGGAIVSAVIATASDPGLNDSDAAAQLQRRRERVRDTLVHLGIPEAKIQYAPAGQADPDAIMAKHADITVELY